MDNPKEPKELKELNDDDESTETAYRWNASISAYLDDPKNPPIYVIFEGNKCRLRKDPERGGIQIMQDIGNGRFDYLLTEFRRDVCLTTGSFNLIEKAREGRKIERDKLRREFRTYLLKYLEMGDPVLRRKRVEQKSEEPKILSFPVMKKLLAQFEDALKRRKPDPGFEHRRLFRFFVRNRLAAQSLRTILKFLREKGYQVDTERAIIQAFPNLVMPSNEDINPFIVELARICKCEDEFRKFIECTPPGQKVRLVICDVENSGCGLHNIDSAFVMKW